MHEKLRGTRCTAGAYILLHNIQYTYICITRIYMHEVVRIIGQPDRGRDVE